jgi:hypothetical protein
MISHRRKAIYLTSFILIVIGALGISLMRTSGKIVDDFRKDDPIYLDLKFFEKNFGGVMPFEISVDTKKKNGVMVGSTIEKINELQNAINTHPEFSKPLSIVELFKFAKQSYYGGDSSNYVLPSSMEKGFILSYLPKNPKAGEKNLGGSLLNSFLDSTKRYTRVSYQMADVPTHHMDSLMQRIIPQVDSIFDPAKYNVKVTGNGIVFARGTNFLIRNLFESVIIAVQMFDMPFGRGINKTKNNGQEQNTEKIFQHNIDGSYYSKLSQHLVWDHDKSGKAQCSRRISHQRGKPDSFNYTGKCPDLIAVTSVFPMVFIQNVNTVLNSDNNNK